MPLYSRLFALLLTPFVVCALRAQAPQTPTERLQEATTLSTVDVAGLRPWHLMLNVTLFDSAGKNPQTGTIEYWHTDTDSLAVMKFGASARSMLHHEGKAYQSVTGPDISTEADAVLSAVLHPGPEPDDVRTSQPDLRKESFGKTPVDCIMLTQPVKRFGIPPLGLFPTYCLGRDSTRLIASYDYGSRTVLRLKVGKFLDHEVTTKLEVKDNSTVVAEAEVATLATFQPAKEFEPTPEMQEEAASRARISSGVVQGLKVGGPQPQYPASARASHTSGSVILRAIITRDGHVRSLRAMNAPDPDLVIAAITAVRQWTYRPYLLNGLPTESTRRSWSTST